jgi:hypothetical protein
VVVVLKLDTKSTSMIYNITQKQAIHNTGHDRARDITSLDIIDVHPKGPYLNTLERYNIVISSQVLFHDGTLMHSKFNTLQLITVHSSPRLLTQV